MSNCPRFIPPIAGLAFGIVLLAGWPAPASGAIPACEDTVLAKVVALDQPFSWNRYGAVEPQGMIYALERDVVDLDDPDGLPSPGEVQALLPGEVMLRKDKRPRPLVLRVNEGQCLEIQFKNRLANTRKHKEQPATRWASVHVIGMQEVTVADDGSYVGVNATSIVAPGQNITYRLFAEREGSFVMHSLGAIVGGEGDGGSISAGLFGAVTVEPAGSEWYRSQVTRADLDNALSPNSSRGGFPTINYNAVYPSTHRYAGLPILRMTQNGEIVHSDLTALITGPGAGDFTEHLPSTTLNPHREKPFREFTIIFHDEIGAVQAFKQFEDNVLAFTLHSVRDGFAINYGTGGIGAEILANRLKVGPVHDCTECKFEEFFLTSWAVGDPAMIVDKPANFPCDGSQPISRNCVPTPGPKATVALFPDDPSNVYHSYLNDRVIFRNLHAGTDDHHIFHLHAHQWTHTPRSNVSSYLDSQAIGPGASFVYETVYGGSGNRPRTPGDSIFHCHFYPHFAQGMWSLWRVHDVLETGTVLDNEGRPTAESRALPDGEIAKGTPIPAVVPVPTIRMAPLPAQVKIVNGQVVIVEDPAVLLARLQSGQFNNANPGYPFWVPAIAGRRPPKPPLDTLFDGGLQRHVVTSGTATASTNYRLDFSKVIDTMNVNWLNENGQPIEQVAMQFHDSNNGYQTPTPKAVPGTPENFRVNTGPAVRGAPIADPCIQDDGTLITPARTRTYKAADIQIDAVFNKSGWHFPQQRITSLLDDVRDTIAQDKPPEPLFIRARSGECVEYQLTNLVPNEYQLDDFQVRTPTDVLGQHIHLVKFDVTSSDGAANGFNYEDGSFGGEEVQERLCAIRRANPLACHETTTGDCNWITRSFQCPVPQFNPAFLNDQIDPDCDGHLENWGAQTTVQRWWADPIPVETAESERARTRTLRTVFTHDHFGPSTHQQAGLYAGLIVEPDNTNWYHNEDGTLMGTRPDGGPTSWQAVIRGSRPEDNFREFGLEFQDFTLAYRPGGAVCPGTNGFADFARAVNPPGRELVGPHPLYENPDHCPTEDDSTGPPRPCPEAVSADDPGMTSVNYRNEPIALRISTTANQQAANRAGDLSFAYMTRRDRARSEFNVFPFAPYLPPSVPYGPLTEGLRRGDPFTPMLRAFEGDHVIIRSLTGAHEEEHNFTIHGLKWLFEPNRGDSGWRNSQHTGISEWFDFEIPRVPTLQAGQFADFLYKPSAATEWQWTGSWGLIRVYKNAYDSESNPADTAPAPGPTETSRDDADAVEPSDLETVDNESLVVLADSNGNTEADTSDTNLAQLSRAAAKAEGIVLSREEEDNPTGPAVRLACPTGVQIRPYDILAVAASEVLADDPFPSLVYNSRDDAVSFGALATKHGPLHDPTAIMFVYREDLTWVGNPPRPRLKQSVRREPLVLRALKGECVKVRLENALPANYQDRDGWNAMPMILDNFNANDVVPSRHVALHPQLLWYDIRRSDGSNVGLNPALFNRQTVAPGEFRTFYWYAGDVVMSGGQLTGLPIEFGATGLSSSDPIKHTNKGAIGALIVEPENVTWGFHNMPEAVPPFSLRVNRRSRAAATIYQEDFAHVPLFQEYVLLFQDDVNLRYSDSGWPSVASLEVNEDPEESGQKAVNYKTEPIWFRTGKLPQTDMATRGAFPNYHLVLSNTWTGDDPETPVFVARGARETRFRLIHAGGHTQGHVFDLHGHIWEELPYVNGAVASEDLGTNPDSQWTGTRDGVGPTSHYDALLKHGAGGAFTAYGDYLYRDYAGWLLDDGIWGLLRVQTTNPEELP